MKKDINFLKGFDGSHFLEKRDYLGSSGIGLCMRKAWYNVAWARGYDGVMDPEGPDLESVYKMGAGNALEGLIVKMLEASGYKLAFTGEGQNVVTTDWGTEGHPDGLIIEDPDDGCEGFILEVKTTGSLKYVRATGPPDYHLHQTADYVFGSGAPGTKFVYLERGWGKTSTIIAHRQFLEPYRAENERRAGVINKALDTGDVNAVPCTPQSWECKSCGFRHQCSGKD
jgi:hypothetical protein